MERIETNLRSIKSRIDKEQSSLVSAGSLKVMVNVYLAYVKQQSYVENSIRREDYR